MARFGELLAKYPSVNHGKGDTFLLRGEQRTEYVGVITKGYVRVYAIFEDGSEHHIALLGPGEHVPIGWCLDVQSSSQHYYQAYTPITVKNIPRMKLLDAFKRDPDAMYDLYVSHEKRMNAMLARITALEHPKAGDKVAFMLLELGDEIGTRLRPYKDRLSLKITQQEIAESTGLTRETAAIELKKLEFAKIISHTRKNYTLYIERLKKYLDDK